MTEIAAKLLEDVYGVSGTRVQVIPHGVPTVPFERRTIHRRAWADGPAGDLQLRADQSRQGARIHDPVDAPDRCCLSESHLSDRRHHPSQVKRQEGGLPRELWLKWSGPWIWVAMSVS